MAGTNFNDVPRGRVTNHRVSRGSVQTGKPVLLPPGFWRLFLTEGHQFIGIARDVSQELLEALFRILHLDKKRAVDRTLSGGRYSIGIPIGNEEALFFESQDGVKTHP